jgi:DNA-binding GntR family transcriptional regulator
MGKVEIPEAGTAVRSAANGSASQDIYEKLRLAIVSGDIRPNTPLIEIDLASDYHVSRTPIRECLMRLGAEGHIVPRKRGWAVREYTPKEVEENFELRMALEGYACRLAATRASADELRLIAGIQEQRDLEPKPSREFRVQTNRQFHSAIIAAAKNSRLEEQIWRVGQLYFNVTLANMTTDSEFKANQADHGRIVSALQNRDEAAAEEAMRAHIAHAFAIYKRVMGD